jgi:hypothetical protein
MEEPVTSILSDITKFGHGITHFDFGPHQPDQSELWCSYNNTIVIVVIVLLIPMPRERGKPRRGAAWYAFDARRKRQQRFERALSMARTQLVHKVRKPRTPPMAYVEEIFPEEPIQVPPEHLLFIVPDNWNPPTCFPGEVTMEATGAQQNHHRGADQMEEPPTCYIEEETLEVMDTQETTRAGELSSGTDEVNAKREQDRPQELDEAMENRDRNEAEDTRPGGEMKEGGWVREGGMAPMPHPLSIMQDCGVSNRHSSTRSTWSWCLTCGARWRTKSTVPS